MDQNEKRMSPKTRSFIISLAVIFLLMVLTYILTLVIPGGQYARVPDANGNMVIAKGAGFVNIEGGIPFWKWILSPFLVLGAAGSGTIIAVIAFLLIIGGIFEALADCGLMPYMLKKITYRFGRTRYKLLTLLTLFFMAMGAMIGSFEEVVPLVPIVVALSLSLGWDRLTGMGMSLLAVGCGFASGVCNPFTVGVAQELAGLPMFSGIWLRIVSFVCIYGLLLLFLRGHAVTVEKPIAAADLEHFDAEPKMDKGLACFAVILGVGIALVLCSSFLTFLQDYTMIIVAVMFLAAGVTSTLVSGMGGKALGKSFGRGVVGFLPAVLMILMASSIRYTLESANVLDTILHAAVTAAATLPRWAVVLFIYLIVLVMNFFVGSGSAKAFMLIPLIAPMAQVFNISTQLSIVAFAFGDGFSNVLYPTNAALLIGLGLADVSYGDWFKWSWKFQAMNLVLTSLLLMFGFAVGY